MKRNIMQAIVLPKSPHTPKQGVADKTGPVIPILALLYQHQWRVSDWIEALTSPILWLFVGTSDTICACDVSLRKTFSAL